MDYLTCIKLNYLLNILIFLGLFCQITRSQDLTFEEIEGVWIEESLWNVSKEHPFSDVEPDWYFDQPCAIELKKVGDKRLFSFQHYHSHIVYPEFGLHSDTIFFPKGVVIEDSLFTLDNSFEIPFFYAYAIDSTTPHISFYQSRSGLVLELTRKGYLKTGWKDTLRFKFFSNPNSKHQVDPLNYYLINKLIGGSYAVFDSSQTLLDTITIDPMGKILSTNLWENRTVKYGVNIGHNTPIKSNFDYILFTEPNSFTVSDLYYNLIFSDSGKLVLYEFNRTTLSRPIYFFEKLARKIEYE